MSKTIDQTTSPARRRTLATPAWVRSLRYSFSREKLREFVMTLGLVVPLTALIWIWAEREQTLEGDVQLTVDVRSRNPNTVVSLARADGRAGASSVIVKLSGPKVGVDSLKAAMASDASRGRITLEVPDDVGADGTRDVAIQPLLDQQNLFRDYGITVRATEPDTFKVRADAVVTADLKPTLTGDVATRVESIETEPATVRVRGSARAIEALRAAQKLRADLDLSAEPKLAATEPGLSVSLKDVPIRPLDAPGVTLETPAFARATLNFSHARVDELTSIVVNISQPSELHATVRIEPKLLDSIKIIGPPEVLRLLIAANADGRDPDARPYATLRITRDDVGKSGTRVPTIANLPNGVRAVVESIPKVSFNVSSGGDDAR